MKTTLSLPLLFALAGLTFGCEDNSALEEDTDQETCVPEHIYLDDCVHIRNYIDNMIANCRLSHGMSWQPSPDVAVWHIDIDADTFCYPYDVVTCPSYVSECLQQLVIAVDGSDCAAHRVSMPVPCLALSP